MAHPIVHVELAARNPAASSKFYAEVFGWKIVRDEGFDYYQFSAEGGPGGGFNEVGERFQAGEVIPYLGTDDIEGDLKKVEQAGGQVLTPKTAIGDMGAFAIFVDPGGNHVGLFAAKTPAA